MTALYFLVVRPLITHSTLDVAVERSQFPIKGIDLSHHNGDVDFSRVARDSVEFVYLKASDGVGDYDSHLDKYYRGARTTPLRVGFYHFFRYNRDGDLQADYFLSVIDKYKSDLPLVIDIEDNSNPAVQCEIVVTRLRTMINRLHELGHRVMLYSNFKEYDTYLKNSFSDIDMWIASSRYPLSGDPRTLWQHSHQGHVDGIDGDVDLNTFVGTRDDWHRWLAQN